MTKLMVTLMIVMAVSTVIGAIVSGVVGAVLALATVGLLGATGILVRVMLQQVEAQR